MSAEDIQKELGGVHGHIYLCQAEIQNCHKISKYEQNL